MQSTGVGAWDQNQRGTHPHLQQEAVKSCNVELHLPAGGVILCSCALLLRTGLSSLVGMKFGTMKESSKDYSQDHKNAWLGALQVLAVPFFTQHPQSGPSGRKNAVLGDS